MGEHRSRHYERFSHALHFAVNDVGMVFFFALAVKEIIEATLPGGPLESPREALVPILAAAGGMIGPAGLYVIQVTAMGRPELMPGWAIPCATDIAFSYLTARFIFPRNHPAIPFLLLRAIADDALGLILLALFYPAAQVSLLTFAALMIPALGITIWLKRAKPDARPAFAVTLNAPTVNAKIRRIEESKRECPAKPPSAASVSRSQEKGGQEVEC